MVEAAGNLLWMFATTDLVCTCTSRAACSAFSLMGVHALTQGTFASKVVQALPWTMDSVITITNPTWAPVCVAGTMLVGMRIAAARLAQQIRPEPPTTATQATATATVPDL